MNTIKKILILLILCLNFLPFLKVSALNIFEDGSDKIIYCGGSGENCSLTGGVESIKEHSELKLAGMNDVNLTATLYFQNIVIKILGFVTLIAIIICLYAGFRILTAVGDDDVIKNQKKVIFSVCIGIIVMWLSATIVKFILDIISTT